MKAFFHDLFVKLPALLRKNRADCWSVLVLEALTDPARFRDRYEEELRFRERLERGWR